MKTILSILLLTSLGLVAQTPPAPPSPPVATAKSAERLSAPLTNTSGGPAALRRLIPPTPRGTVAPAVPASNPASAAATLPIPSGPTTAVNPTTAATTAPGAVTPQPLTAPKEETIPPGHINWTAADLPQVLATYAELVDRSVLRLGNLAAPAIVFKNQTTLTKKEFIQALDALLALNGIAVISVGEKFLKAVPIAQAGTVGGVIATNNASELPDLGGYHAHIVQLKYIKPSEVLAVITPFASVGLPPPIPIESSQLLVIRDNAENVKRMLEMIEKVDITVQSEFVSEVIPIKFAKVADIAAALNSLSGGGGGASIGARSATTGGAPGFSTGARGQPGQPGYNPSQSITPGGTVSSPQGTPSSTATFSDRIRNIISKASSSTGGSGDLQIIGVTKVVADERSNSLLIFASRQDMAMIKDIIAKLDVVLAQVLIETIILDVTVGDTWALGVSAAQREKNFTPELTGAGGYNNANSFFNWLNSVTSNSVTRGQGQPKPTPSLPPGFSYFAKFNESLDVVLQAAAGDNRVKVIQKPRIQTSHATPASLFIGSTVPYVSSTYYGGGYSGGPSSSYQQLQVGIGLNVTPFINSDGLVVMKIDEQISELDGSTPITGVGDVPNTKTSSLSAEIAVRDGESVILGGIIRNANEKKNSGVPFLKDIPLLGAIFRTASSTSKRQETVVLMRPTVLRTPELAALQVKEEKKRMPNLVQAEEEFDREEQKAFEKSQKKPRNKTTSTPPATPATPAQPSTPAQP